MADYNVTVANIRFSESAQLEVGIAADELAKGQAVVKDSNGRWTHADAAETDAEERTRYGVTASPTPAAGQPVLVCVKDTNYTPGFTMAVTEAVYVSGNAGGEWMPQADLASGNAIVPCMVPFSTTQAVFDPQPTGKVVP
ncbi:MAG: hypothetical protein OXE95_07925 [Chloroflexi bacterium]|nr:hypothetical protein [Chloroflexota bacterium]